VNKPNNITEAIESYSWHITCMGE